MFALSPTIKPLATSVSIAVLMATTMPVSTVQAHDRHNASKHFGHGTHINKKRHRNFHNRFGRGVQGQRAYRNLHAPRHAKKRRKSDKGDLIAAGIIGLAIGAIIASESAKRNNQPTYRYSDPYQEPYYGNSHRGGHVPLNEYDETYSDYRYENVEREPRVITYNDPGDLAPWTPGWRDWCEQNYRSFNASRGTYRGYDGLDHFCVPK